MNIAVLGLVLLAGRAGAANSFQVKRGDLDVVVRVTGTVVADDRFDIKSPIDGRVERVLASTAAWQDAGRPLAILAHKELSAMLDAKGAQNREILEDRWQSIHRATPVSCLAPCFILKNFLQPGTWIKAESVMFEAASTLKLVGRVRPEDAAWIRDGQELSFWPLKNPKRVFKGRVTRFLLDVQGERVSPGAAFTLTLSPARYLEPGAEWEGRIVAMTKKDALYVPTDALIRHGDAVYLPVRVSTGVTTQGLTQISSGVEEKCDALALADGELNGTARHKQEIAVARSRPALMPEDAPEPGPTPQERARITTTIDDVEHGEDLYAEPP
jgi:multidrug efflux pump subunit AcrA (membrane-fusion protein)